MIAVQSQPGQIVRGTLSRKKLHKNGAGGEAQGEGPEFKPQYHKKKKKERKKEKEKKASLFLNFKWSLQDRAKFCYVMVNGRV
jgi:hypothetical protein